MWLYEKRLQHPVNIKESSATLAQAIIEQYGGPNGIRHPQRGIFCMRPAYRISSLEAKEQVPVPFTFGRAPVLFSTIHLQ